MSPTRMFLFALVAGCGGGGGGRDPGTTPTGTPGGTPLTGAGSPITVDTTFSLPATEHSNLLILSIDTLRKDHIGRYDPQGRDLTPFLDSLLDQAVVADNHKTGSNWTYHSFSTSLAGRYPIEEGVLPRVVPDDWMGWPAGSRFLADELKDAGFYAVMASANGWLAPYYGLSKGYDVYLGAAFDPADTIYTLGSDALQGALDSGLAGDRWYLHLHFLEPHAPYVPPAEYRVGEDQLDPLPYDIDTQPSHYEHVNAWPSMTPEERDLLEAHLHVRYEGEIRWLDDRLAAFWADMQARGWLDDTLVVIFTDHGEQFWERNNQTHAFHLFPEETNGLFALWSPQLAPQSTTVPTSGVNIAPTVMRHLGLSAPSNWTGRPLSEVDPLGPVFNDANGRLGVVHSVIEDQQELIYLWTGTTYYYDLTVDPGHGTNRYDPEDPTVQALWERIRPRIELGRPSAPYQTPVPPEGLSL